VQDPPVTNAEHLTDAVAALNLVLERARDAFQRLNAILGEHLTTAPIPLDDVPPGER
jgi:hypothetical protein